MASRNPLISLVYNYTKVQKGKEQKSQYIKIPLAMQLCFFVRIEGQSSSCLMCSSSLMTM